MREAVRVRRRANAGGIRYTIINQILGGVMQIGVPKETWPGEVRCALVPANASKLIKLGFSISMEGGAGAASGFSDDLFVDAGVTIGQRNDVIAAADLLICVRKPDVAEVSMLKCHHHKLP